MEPMYVLYNQCPDYITFIRDSVYSYNTIYCWSVLYIHYRQNLVAAIKLQFIAIYMYRLT